MRDSCSLPNRDVTRRGHVDSSRPSPSSGPRSPSDEPGVIVTAQRAILNEIDADGLIERLLVVAVELVSAERGLLFLQHDETHQVEAEVTRQSGGLRVACRSALARPPAFPDSVLRYVLRTEERIVLDDALAENLFSKDSYLSNSRTRSILCLPLVAQRNLIGVLYLENSEPRAVGPQKLAALELLALPAAISLTSVRVLANLKHEVSGRIKTEDELKWFRQMYGERHSDTPGELMGDLTAALAHELNQPLAAIRSSALGVRRLLEARNPDLAKAKAVIEDIIQGNSRAAEIVRNVRSVFQREAAEMAAVNLLRILHDSARIVRADAAVRGITMRLELPASLPDVFGNETQLIQILMNLIFNAFEAMCEIDDDGPRELVISARQCESRHVHVAIRDSGRGIEPEIMSRLFKPFFTTKPNGMGMGLGIVRSIIENHGGRVQASANPDRGATFEFQLPVGRRVKGTALSEIAHSTNAGCGTKVQLVTDASSGDDFLSGLGSR